MTHPEAEKTPANTDASTAECPPVSTFRLHCRRCPASYLEMVDLIRHAEREHEPPRPKRTKRLKNGDA